MADMQITVEIPEELAIRLERAIRPSQRSKFVADAVLEKMLDEFGSQDEKTVPRTTDQKLPTTA